MKRGIVFLAVLLLSGCMGKTYVASQNKIDFDPVTGERRAPTNDLTDKRKVLVWEIELGKDKGQPKEHKAISESTSDSSYTSSSSSAVSTPEPATETPAATASEATATTAAGDKAYTEYTVQKNDTLQKISQKLYGTTKKWLTIYNENKDVLKGPDKVYPGLKLKVPSK